MRVLFKAPSKTPVVRDLEPTRDAIIRQLGDGCKELAQEDRLDIACFYDNKGLENGALPNCQPIGMRHVLVGNIIMAKKDFSSLNDIEIARLKRQFV